MRKRGERERVCVEGGEVYPTTLVRLKFHLFASAAHTARTDTDTVDAPQTPALNKHR